MEKYCEWIKYDYRTICPREHDANNPYWRIPADTDKLKYCPYCGKKGIPGMDELPELTKEVILKNER